MSRFLTVTKICVRLPEDSLCYGLIEIHLKTHIYIKKSRRLTL